MPSGWSLLAPSCLAWFDWQVSPYLCRSCSVPAVYNQRACCPFMLYVVLAAWISWQTTFNALEFYYIFNTKVQGIVRAQITITHLIWESRNIIFFSYLFLFSDCIYLILYFVHDYGDCHVAWAATIFCEQQFKDWHQPHGHRTLVSRDDSLTYVEEYFGNALGGKCFYL